MTKQPREYSTAEYKRARKELLEHHPLCHWCKTAPATEADHLREVDAGGTHLDGLVPACKSCNAARGARHLNRKRTIQQQQRNQAVRDQGVFLNDSFITPSQPFSARRQFKPLRFVRVCVCRTHRNLLSWR